MGVFFIAEFWLKESRAIMAGCGVCFWVFIGGAVIVFLFNPTTASGELAMAIPVIILFLVACMLLAYMWCLCRMGDVLLGALCWCFYDHVVCNPLGLLPITLKFGEILVKVKMAC